MNARSFALAAAWYLALALWVLKVVLTAPASTVAFPIDFAGNWERLLAADQNLRVAQVTTSARRLLHDPAHFFDGSQCYPVADALTLGEHEIGSALLGLTPTMLGADPILTYNLVAILTVALAGIAMHALVREWTHSGVAALVAGTLFELCPTRLVDLTHLGVIGNHWTPLALLFARRLFVVGSWGSAAGFALFATLQTFESVYPLLAFAIVGGALGIWLLSAHWRRLPQLAGPIVVAVAIVAATAAAVLNPYFAMRETWGTFGGRTPFLQPIGSFAPGGRAYPGTVLVVLAAAGLVDRLRRPPGCHGSDPRLALSIAGVLIVWASALEIPLPGTYVVVPSLFTLAARVVPGLDGIRRAADVAAGFSLVLAVLAGYGVAALGRRRGRVGRAALAILLMVATGTEILIHPLARASFGFSLAMRARPILPPPFERAVLARMGPGAVLDLPFDFDSRGMVRMADYVLLGAYHGHPVAACYNSYRLPVQQEIAALGARLQRDPSTADALAALGFGSVLVHRRSGSRLPAASPVGAMSQLVEVERNADTVLYRLESRAPLTVGFSPLAVPDGTQPAVLEVSARQATIDVSFENHASVTYRHPDPLVPSDLDVTWRSAAGDVRSERVRVLLPLALAGGERVARALPVTAPAEPGDYSLTVARADEPLVVLAALTVRVVTPRSGP